MLEIALLYLPKVDKIYAYCMPLKEYFKKIKGKINKY